MSDDINSEEGRGGCNDSDDPAFKDLPTRGDSTLRLSLERKQDYLSDMLRAAKDRDLPGLLVTGGPGIGKSFLVDKLLGGKRNYERCSGLLTRPMAIEKLQKHRDRLIVFDDVAGCTKDPVYHQMMLHIVGPGDSETGGRLVEYSTTKGNKKFTFTGAIVFIGNSAFAGAPAAVLDALNSRVRTVVYHPTRDELEWQVYDLAERGLKGLPPHESVQLVTSMLRECRAAGRDPELRLLLDGVVPMYIRCQLGKATCSWEEHLHRLVHEPATAKVRCWTDGELKAILINLQEQFASTAARVEEYLRLTGRSRATFFRDMGRLLPPSESQSPSAA